MGSRPNDLFRNRLRIRYLVAPSAPVRSRCRQATGNPFRLGFRVLHVTNSEQLKNIC